MSRTYIPAEVRRLVRERARELCEYCLIPESAVFTPHEGDHIVAKKHGGETATNNLAFSCVLCNKHKGSDLASIDPATGDIVPLFHPRRNRWTEHFHILEGRIDPVTAIGRVTARLLQFNHPDRIEERELLLAAGLIQSPEA